MPKIIKSDKCPAPYTKVDLPDGKQFVMERVPYVLFDTQNIENESPDIEKDSRIRGNFFSPINKNEYKTNMICDGCINEPNRFILHGISFALLNAKDKEDMFCKSLAEFIIGGRTMFSIPVREAYYPIITKETAKEIYKNYTKRMEKLDSDFFPFSIKIETEDDLIVIPPQINFRVTVKGFGEVKPGECEAIAMLHGISQRPAM